MKTAWDMAPLCSEEGMLSGEVIQIRPLHTVNGCQILIKVTDEPVTPDYSQMQKTLEQLETRLKANNAVGVAEAMEAAKRLLSRDAEELAFSKVCLKATVFFDGWKCADEDEEDVELLVKQICPGHRLTLRMSKNWRKNAVFCRYIKNETLGLESGYKEEATWKALNHTYGYISKPGTYEKVTILSTNPFLDDFDKPALMLEICINNDSTFKRYCSIVPSGTDAYKQLSAQDPQLIYKYKVTIEIEIRDKKAFVTSCTLPQSLIQVQKQQENKKVQKKLTASVISGKSPGYKTMREIADQTGYIDASEYPTTQGIYKMTIFDDKLTDFIKPRFDFLPLESVDGRQIYAEIRSDAGKTRDAKKILSEYAIAKNDLKSRARMYPGVHVTAYFTPSQRSSTMILRVLTIDDDARTVQLRRVEYFRQKLIEQKIIPSSEAKTNLTRMDDETLNAYEAILKNTAKKGVH